MAFSTQASKTDNFWQAVAQDAWGYFQPGIGVDERTGLVRNTVGSNEFTDWDLGLYIQAILDAETLGLIKTNGSWGADDRLNKVLTFLEQRPLMKSGLPYLSYSSLTGQNASLLSQVATDAGCLFVSLKNVENAKPELKQRIDTIVYNLTNYEPHKHQIDILLKDIQRGHDEPTMYDYYVSSGFAYFWPERFTNTTQALLDYSLSCPVVNCSGVDLPQTKIAMEPLLLELFNLPNCDPRVAELTRKAYLAQEARFNQTGKYTAFSEGPTDSGFFVYEWIVSAADGKTWVLQTISADFVKTYVSISPIVYLKAAMGCLAVYNTSYAQDMVAYLLSKVSSSDGFSPGVNEEGRVITCAPDVSNGLILSAAKYGIVNNVTVPLDYSTHRGSAAASADTGSTQTLQGTNPVITPTPSPTPAPTATVHPTSTVPPSPIKVNVSDPSIGGFIFQ
jgi:hypothetical protein